MLQCVAMCCSVLQCVAVCCKKGRGGEEMEEFVYCCILLCLATSCFVQLCGTAMCQREKAIRGVLQRESVLQWVTLLQ